MRSHEKIKRILEKSQTMNHYDAIGIITIITIVGLVINAIRLIQYCNSPKAIALISQPLSFNKSFTCLNTTPP